PASMRSVTLFTASVALNRLQRATSSSAAPRMLWLTPACCARRATSSTLNSNAEVHKLGKSAAPLPVVWASRPPSRRSPVGRRAASPTRTVPAFDADELPPKPPVEDLPQTRTAIRCAPMPMEGWPRGTFWPAVFNEFLGDYIPHAPQHAAVESFGEDVGGTLEG